MREIFESILGAENVMIDEPMSKHTTFKIGGNADYFLTPENENQLKEVFFAAKRAGLPTIILGNGSNLLVGDKGIRGVVICLYKKLDKIEVSGDELVVGCGALLSRVSSTALKAELQGFEFASGIPGTVGGGVYMNAGAYGFELKDIIKTVRYMDADGNISDIDGKLCEFGYRESIFAKKEYTVLGCTFKLSRGKSEEIRAR
ncbi:MAG: UDP-N-acetylmuramate dehydrogenase, partial [Clostridia bacterium]|nr:UDP-N-acetylmuramate dehydrogenase [Clostridia bacterium]